MNSEAELLQKLMISKKIMEKHQNIERNQTRNISSGSGLSAPIVEDYNAPLAKYNIPSDILEESRPVVQQRPSNIPVEQRIASSKLPDEIKRLMMEHPIQQPTMGTATGAVLSDDLVERASRLMNTNTKNNVTESEIKRQVQTQQHPIQSSLSGKQIKDIVRETVEDVLKENGLLIESETRSNEIFKFRVGEHLFEGKVTKVKKIAK